MNTIEETIRKNRPAISTTSIKTYLSCLRSIFKRLKGEGEPSQDWYRANHEAILSDIASRNVSSFKTACSALFVLTGLESYSSAMRDGIKRYDDEVATRKPSAKDAEAAIPFDDIVAARENAKPIFETVRKMKGELTPSLFLSLQSYPLLCVYTMVQPRRLLDYTAFKIRDIDFAKDNYYDAKKSEFVFNTFKTAKSHGAERIAVPKELAIVLKAYTKALPESVAYLFSTAKHGKLSQSALNARLNELLGGKRSVNAIRKSFLTSKYGATMDAMDALADDMKAMGSSVSVADNYIKRTA